MPTDSDQTLQLIQRCAANTNSRFDFWAQFIHETSIKKIAEVGVYAGEFAAHILQKCPRISRYYMVDPWKHLSDWNKPANLDDTAFERICEAAKARTNFAAARRVILRGRTSEVVHRIQDQELDLAYIDGDHTLRGITIDLIQIYPKVRAGGFIGGDDFSSTIWTHRTTFEPTLVFPFAVYFAEAVGATIYALPNVQFCLQKLDTPAFRFFDLTGHYPDLTLKSQIESKKLMKVILGERFPRTRALFGRMRALLP